MPRRRPVAMLLSCSLAASVASIGSGQDVQTVHLADGTSVAGEVVEYVAGDHVVLRLATGETRRIAWSDMAGAARAPRLDGTPLPPLPSASVLSPPPPLPSAPTAPEPPTGTTSPPPFTLMPVPWSADLGALRPELEKDPQYGWSPKFSLGVMSGYASPFGYLSLDAVWFPWRWPILRGIGFEATVAMPVADQPVTLGETLLFEFDIGDVSFGMGAGLAQAWARPIIPGDQPGIVSLFDADLSHLTVRITPQLSVRGRWGLALFINGDYCTAHPEACPQIANYIPFYGDAAVAWTFDFSGH